MRRSEADGGRRRPKTTPRRRPRALVSVVHAEEAPGDDLRRRHDGHAAVGAPPPRAAGGRSTSRTAADCGRTTRPACARPTGTTSAIPGQMWERTVLPGRDRERAADRGRGAHGAPRARVRRLHAGVGRVPAQAPPGAGVPRPRHLARARERRPRDAVGHRHALRRAGGGDEAAPGAGVPALRHGPRAGLRGVPGGAVARELPARRCLAAGARLRRAPARDSGLGRARVRGQPVLRADRRTADPAGAADALGPLQRRHRHAGPEPLRPARMGVGVRLDGRADEVRAGGRRARRREPRRWWPSGSPTGCRTPIRRRSRCSPCSTSCPAGITFDDARANVRIDLDELCEECGAAELAATAGGAK